MMTNDLAIRILSGDVLGTTEQTHEAVAMAVKALAWNDGMRWAPCAERPPEEGEEVFVYLFGLPYIAWFDGSQWKTEEFEVDEEYAPAAWMPLPEPYKEERN